MKTKDIIKNGLIKENPTWVLVLGMCPTLATTTSAINGLSMGLATTFVLMMSNIVISLLKSVIPDKVRRTLHGSRLHVGSHHCGHGARAVGYR